MNKNRVAWVDYSKGICIFAVVTLYSAEAAKAALGDPGWMQYWVDFARPFRMPDFFLISGLFLARVIDRPWSTYLDKKVLHYSYFFLLWSGINLIIYNLIKGESFAPPQLIIKYWSMISSWPFHMLWFIQMLPAYFLLTRLVRKIPKLVVLLAAVLLQAFNPFDTGRTIVDEFWHRYVYFFVGYAYAHLFFELAHWLQSRKIPGLLILTCWAIVNGTLVFGGFSTLPFVSFLLGVSGATAVIISSVLICNISWLRVINYFGEHSIVVYLAFYWPMRAATALFLSSGLPSSYNGIFTVLATFAGIVGAFLLYQVSMRAKPLRFLFERPRLFTLPYWKSFHERN